MVWVDLFPAFALAAHGIRVVAQGDALHARPAAALTELTPRSRPPAVCVAERPPEPRPRRKSRRRRRWRRSLSPLPPMITRTNRDGDEL